MIGKNVKRVMSEIGNVKLVAVTKARAAEDIKTAINSGVGIIAENRVQEAEEKYNGLEGYLKQRGIGFHLIGHLQRNKVKRAVAMFDMIQSVDSLELAGEIDKWAGKIDKVQEILIQINIGKEKQRHGIMPEKAIGSIDEISKLRNIKIKGLMCIAPYFETPEKTRPYFRMMKSIFDKPGLEILSMGMSNDYKIAIEEGSTMVRLGTAIFGERKY